MLDNKYYSYYKCDSYIHKSNACCKIFNFLMLILLIISPNYINVLASVFVVIISGVFSCAPIKKYFRYLYSFRYFIIIFTIILIICSVKCDIIFLAIIQLIAIILYGATLIYTTSIIEIIDAISSILKPLGKLKINYRKLSIVIGILFSAFSLLLESKNKIIESQSSRGNDYRYRNAFSKFIIILASTPNIIKLGYSKMIELKKEIIKKGYLSSNNSRKMKKPSLLDILFILVLFCSLLYLFIERLI